MTSGKRLQTDSSAPPGAERAPSSDPPRAGAPIGGADSHAPRFISDDQDDIELEHLVNGAIDWFNDAKTPQGRARAYEVFLDLRKRRRPEFIAALEAARLARVCKPR